MIQSDIQFSDLMIKMDALAKNQEELKGEVKAIRNVVIGNGNSLSILNQIKDLQHQSQIAQEHRKRIEVQISKLEVCTKRMESETVKDSHAIERLANGQDDIINRLDKLELCVDDQGDLIQAFRNRVIGIVAVLSLLAGAGVGFAAAARLIAAAVP